MQKLALHLYRACEFNPYKGTVFKQNYTILFFIRKFLFYRPVNYEVLHEASKTLYT